MPITPNYPTSIDNTSSLPDPNDNSFTNNPDHAQLHAAENQILRSLETKVGFGSSNPTSGTTGYILTSNGDGSSSWTAPPAAGVWGLITGTLSNQTDLAAALAGKLALGGGTLTGPLILAADPTTALGAATKQYADKMVPLAGGTMTGPLILNADPSNVLGAATKEYVDNLGTATLIQNETPGGSINGSNTAFTTASVFNSGSLRVYLNGQRLTAGSGVDYVEVTQGFTMQYAPATGDVLLVDYNVTNTHFIQGSNSIVTQEVPSGTVNGSNTSFTTQLAKYVANTLEVFINGVAQVRGTDYTETTPGSGVFTMTVAPYTNDTITVCYQFSTGASGNAQTVNGVPASPTGGINGDLIPDYAGWNLLPGTLTYASATSFTTSQNLTGLLNVGDKIWLVQASTNYYFVVTAVTSTTVTVTGGSDYSVQNATITTGYYSKYDTPNGFPGAFNYTPTWTGFSSNPPTTGTRFSVRGRTVFFQLYCTSTGTSNATTTTVSLPIPASSATNAHWRAVAGQAVDNSGSGVASEYDFASGATTAGLYASAAGATWTASGGKQWAGLIVYEI